jgi:hypothetical protein
VSNIENVIHYTGDRRLLVKIKKKKAALSSVYKKSITRTHSTACACVIMCNTHLKKTPLFPPEIKLTTLSHTRFGIYVIKTEGTIDLFVNDN